MPSKNTPQEIDPAVFASDDNTQVDMPSTGYAIDFASVPDQQELIVKGTYEAVIKNAEPVMSKTSGNPMIKLRWQIADGEYEGRTVFDQLVFTRPTGDWNADFPLRKIKELLLAIGYDARFGGQVIPENLIGERCMITVKIDQGKGMNPETGEPYPPKNAVASYATATSRRKVDDLL